MAASRSETRAGEDSHRAAKQRASRIQLEDAYVDGNDALEPIALKRTSHAINCALHSFQFLKAREEICGEIGKRFNDDDRRDPGASVIYDGEFDLVMDLIASGESFAYALAMKVFPTSDSILVRYCDGGIAQGTVISNPLFHDQLAKAFQVDPSNLIFESIFNEEEIRSVQTAVENNTGPDARKTWFKRFRNQWRSFYDNPAISFSEARVLKANNRPSAGFRLGSLLRELSSHNVSSALLLHLNISGLSKVSSARTTASVSRAPWDSLGTVSPEGQSYIDILSNSYNQCFAEPLPYEPAPRFTAHELQADIERAIASFKASLTAVPVLVEAETALSTSALPSVSAQASLDLLLSAPSQAPNPVAASAHTVPAPAASALAAATAAASLLASGSTSTTSVVIPAAHARGVSAPAASDPSPAYLATTRAETAAPSTATSATENFSPAVSAASLSSELLQLFANRFNTPLSLQQQSHFYNMLPNAQSRQKASPREKVFFAPLDVGSILKRSRENCVWRRSKGGVASIARRYNSMEDVLERLCLDLLNDIVAHTSPVAPQITLVVQPVSAQQSPDVVSGNPPPLPVAQQSQATPDETRSTDQDLLELRDYTGSDHGGDWDSAPAPAPAPAPVLVAGHRLDVDSSILPAQMQALVHY